MADTNQPQVKKRKTVHIHDGTLSVPLSAFNADSLSYQKLNNINAVILKGNISQSAFDTDVNGVLLYLLPNSVKSLTLELEVKTKARSNGQRDFLMEMANSIRDNPCLNTLEELSVAIRQNSFAPCEDVNVSPEWLEACCYFLSCFAGSAVTKITFNCRKVSFYFGKQGYQGDEKREPYTKEEANTLAQYIRSGFAAHQDFLQSLEVHWNYLPAVCCDVIGEIIKHSQIKTLLVDFEGNKPSHLHILQDIFTNTSLTEVECTQMFLVKKDTFNVDLGVVGRLIETHSQLKKLTLRIAFEEINAIFSPGLNSDTISTGHFLVLAVLNDLLLGIVRNRQTLTTVTFSSDYCFPNMEAVEGLKKWFSPLNSLSQFQYLDINDQYAPSDVAASLSDFVQAFNKGAGCMDSWHDAYVYTNYPMWTKEEHRGDLDTSLSEKHFTL